MKRRSLQIAQNKSLIPVHASLGHKTSLLKN